jgi:uncharacterized NAD(P)/FAD-binding protein YdhS
LDKSFFVETIKILLVGGGPSCFRVIKRLAEKLQCNKVEPVEVFIIEKYSRIGVGLPYSDRAADKDHRIAANEEKTRFEKGMELENRFLMAIEKLRHIGCKVHIKLNSSVVDIWRESNNYLALLDNDEKLNVNYVILAMGHWPVNRNFHLNNYIASPWPINDVLDKCRKHEKISIVGTSLTAIDLAISLAKSKGRFIGTDNDVSYSLNGSNKIHIELSSRSGMLPRVAGYGITKGLGEENGSLKYDKYLKEADIFLLRRGDKKSTLSYMYRRLKAEFMRTSAKDFLIQQLACEGVFTGSFSSDMNQLRDFLLSRDAKEVFYKDIDAARQSIELQEYIPWQSLLWQKTDIFWWLFHLFNVDDRKALDEHAYQILCFTRPLNYYNAVRIKALLAAGVLTLSRSEFSERNSLDNYNNFDVVVDCRGQTRDILQCSDPLINSLLKRGIIKPATINCAAVEGGIFNCGGIDVDPYTLEVKHDNNQFFAPKNSGMYAIGPLILGFYPISDGLHPLHKLALNIVDDIFRKILVSSQEDK